MSLPFKPPAGASGAWGAPARLHSAQLDAMVQQGWQLQQAGQAEQARQLYEQVLKHQPKHANALHLMGVLQMQAGDNKAAVDFITRALKIDRDNASAYNNRGAAYAALGDLDLALLNYNKAIALKPDLDSAYNNRGNAFNRLGRFDEALPDFDRAIALRADYFEAHFNRCLALCGLARDDEAVASYERAIALRPDMPAMRWNLGMCLLRMGKFERGWQESEARLEHWQRHSGLKRPAQPAWTGAESLHGKTLLVQCEQGLGDTIQFSRYLPLLAQQAARVLFEVQRPLVAVLQALPGVEVVAQGSELPAFDLHVSLLSLPGIFGTNAGNVPPPPHCIHPPAERVAEWESWLGPKTRPRVGIAWSGNAKHVDDLRRSMSLQTFAALLSSEIEWVSLHKDVRESDLPMLKAHPEIRRVESLLNDYTDTAALIASLDLVICVDTSVAHLAGTMGKPVWLLVARNPDWRWLRHRSDSPWYPSMKVWREDKPDDWASLLARIKAELPGFCRALVAGTS